VNKITQKLDYTAQLLSTQTVITVPTFKVDENVLTFSPLHLRSRFCHWLIALSIMQWSKWRHSSISLVVFQMVDVTDPAEVDWLLKNAQDRVYSFIKKLFFSHPILFQLW